MKVIENGAYWNRLLLYKGAEDRERAARLAGGPLAVATYGLRRRQLVPLQRPDARSAREVFTSVVAGPQWPAFGFIASEAELARTNNLAAGYGRLQREGTAVEARSARDGANAQHAREHGSHASGSHQKNQSRSSAHLRLRRGAGARGVDARRSSGDADEAGTSVAKGEADGQIRGRSRSAARQDVEPRITVRKMKVEH